MRQSACAKVKAMQSGRDPSADSIRSGRDPSAGSGRDVRRMSALEETIAHYVLIPPKFARYPLVEDILWMGVLSVITGERSATAALGLMEEQVVEVLR